MTDPTIINITKKREKLIVTGKASSGKDFLIRGASIRGLLTTPKWTTRPKRKNETQDVDYNFVTLEEFKKGIEESIFLEWESFFIEDINGSRTEVFYGTTKDNFEKGQAFILTPSAISKLPDEIRKKCFIVYLDIDKEVRLERLKKRMDMNDKILRRIENDENDFLNFQNFDLKIKDPDFDIPDILGLMY